MSTITIPGIRRSRPKHRAVDRVSALEAENRRLLEQLVGASGHIARLESQMEGTSGKQAAAEEKVVQLDADKRELTEQRDMLADENEALLRQLAPYLAAEANKHAVTVPPMVRDTEDGADQATQPIDVREIQARFACGPVVSLRYSPQAADPTSVPSAT